MDNSGRITFKANEVMQRVLKDLQHFYGTTTRSKLMNQVVSETLLAVYRNPMSKDLTATQLSARKRIVNYVDSVRKELKKMQCESERESKRSKTKKNR